MIFRFGLEILTNHWNIQHVFDQMVNLLVEDVLCVPTAGCNLFLPGLALDQGYRMTWDNDARLFWLIKDEAEVIRAQYEIR